MTDTPNPQKPFLVARWRSWVPPVVVTLVVLVALVFLGPEGPAVVFRYKLF